MNIENLVTQDNANEGVWFQAVLYGRKQNFDVKIIGADSDTVQQYQREQARKMKTTLKSGKSSIGELDDETFDELLDSTDDDIVIRINGLRTHNKHEEPLTMGDVTLGNDKKSYSFILEKIPALKEFILKKSNERLNFLS